MKTLFDALVGTDTGLEWEKGGMRTRRDLQVCAAAVLLHAGEVDGHLVMKEVDMIVKRLADEFALTPPEAAEVIEVGGVFRRSGRSLQDLVVAINNRFEKSQKIIILGMIWNVFLADGIIKRSEADFATNLASALGLTDKDMDEVKARV